MPYVADRSAFVLVPEQPMLDWVRQVTGDELDMDTLFGEAEVYLVPAFEEDDEMDAVLEQMWPKLFEIELQTWTRDKASWPQKRSLELFMDWFRFTPFNGVHDLGPSPLQVENN